MFLFEAKMTMKHMSRKVTARRNWPSLVSSVALASVLFGLAGCRDMTRMATEAVAGKEVAQAMEGGQRDATAKQALAESKRLNSDPRVLMGTHLSTSWMEFRTQPKPMQAGQEAIWTMNIWQAGKIAKNRNWVGEFKYVNEKLLHLTVVSKDLSYFNHIHPDFRGDGLFITSQTLPHGGTYKAYADYTPMRGVQEVAQHEFKVLGSGAVDERYSMPDQNSAPQLKADELVNGWMTQRVVSRPESQPQAEGGETYNVGLMPMPKLVVGQPVMLHFRIRNSHDRPVSDLQPYLGAMGHAVILSADTKIFLHTNPADNSGGMGEMSNDDQSSTRLSKSDAVFQAVFPAAGLYKVWGQFQHKGRIITAPFVVNVEATKAGTVKMGTVAAASE
jgi:hypothetical protein